MQTDQRTTWPSHTVAAQDQDEPRAQRRHRAPPGRSSGSVLATLLLFAVASAAMAHPQVGEEGLHPFQHGAERSGMRPPKNAIEAPAPAARGRVFYDDQQELGLWARGETYKAGFSREGAMYAPFLGSDAPRTFPVAFRIVHASQGGTPIGFDPAAAPLLEGDSVRFARGGFEERYEISLASIEQIFVFEELPGEGEVVLRIAAETDLEARETAEELRFECDLGAVRYGRATAFDARGASVAAPTAWTEHGIEIRVPADFVASAALPLVIDPVVSTFAVDSTSRDSYFPDVAYDPSLDRWLVVYEEQFSTSDHDVRYRLLSASGALLQENFADVSLTQNWADPAVAYNRRLARFLIVAETGFAPNRTIQARLVTSAGLTVGPGIVLSTPDEPGDKLNPDVGGDPRTTGTTLFCVTWERIFTSSDRDIHYRTISPEGALQGGSTSYVDNSGLTYDEQPSISKSNLGDDWNLVWTRRIASGAHDLRGARIGQSGVTSAPSFSILSGVGTDVEDPSAASSLAGTDRWIVSYSYDTDSGTGTDKDVSVIALDGSVVISAFSLTGMETFTGQSTEGDEQQIRPDADSDGSSFAVAYSESYQGGPDYDIYVSTVALTGTQLALTEGHENLAFSATTEDYPAIASRAGSGGGLQRHFVAWHDFISSGGHLDVEAGLYDTPLFTPYCTPGLTWVPPCPCNNPPLLLDRGCNNSSNTGGAKLSASGTPSLASDTALLSTVGSVPTALSVYNQGNAVLASAVTFGQGKRCVGGSLKRLYVKTAVGGQSSAPAAGDASVSARSAQLGDAILPGSTRGYYVYYRDPVVLGGCPPTSTFNTSQAVQAVWIP